MTVSAYVVQYRLKSLTGGNRWGAWKEYGKTALPVYAEYLRGKVQAERESVTLHAVETRIIRQKVSFRA